MKNETRTEHHTPGPWALGGQHADGSWEVIVDGKRVLGHFEYEDCGGDDKSDAPAEANARLAAAAPDILAALIRMEDWAATIDDEDSRVPADIRIEARAAIVKALGENAE